MSNNYNNCKAQSSEHHSNASGNKNKITESFIFMIIIVVSFECW